MAKKVAKKLHGNDEAQFGGKERERNTTSVCAEMHEIHPVMKRVLDQEKKEIFQSPSWRRRDDAEVWAGIELESFLFPFFFFFGGEP